MIHIIRRPWRLAAVAALICVAALLSLSASPASARIVQCAATEFCLYVNADANGGIYHFAGSDRNLSNDRYDVANTDITVGNTARNAANNGVRGPKDDVIIYSRPNWQGASDCIRRGEFGALPRNWWNNIESYRWVTDAQCKAAGPPLDLGNHNIP